MAKTISHDCESALCSELKVPKTLQGSDLEDFVSLTEDEKAEWFMDVFSSPFSLCFSFLREPEQYLWKDDCNVDFDSLAKIYSNIIDSFDQGDANDIFNKVYQDFYDSISSDEGQEVKDPWIFRSCLILLSNPLLDHPEGHTSVDIIIYTFKQLMKCSDDPNNIIKWI